MFEKYLKLDLQRSICIWIDSSETSQPYIALKTPTSGATRVHKPCRSEIPGHPGSPCLGGQRRCKERVIFIPRKAEQYNVEGLIEIPFGKVGHLRSKISLYVTELESSRCLAHKLSRQILSPGRLIAYPRSFQRKPLFKTWTFCSLLLKSI